MLRVGIYAPYVRNETTLAAVQFADWLVRIGIEVSFLSEGKVETGVHPAWDKRVQRANRVSIYGWAYQSTHLCWFSPNAKALHHARLACFNNERRRTKHFYFPRWCKWNQDCDNFLQGVDKVISFSRDMHLWIQQYKEGDLLAADRDWANLVVSDQVLVPKYGKVEQGKTKLLIVIPKNTCEETRNLLLTLVARLLLKRHDLSITLLLECSWPRTQRRWFKRMQKSYPGRLEQVSSPPYWDYVGIARNHDWMYLAGQKYAYGSLIAMLVSSTVPIICHDVPPVGAHVLNDDNGKLIPCQLQDYQHPEALIDMKDVEKSILDVLNRPTVFLKSIQVQCKSQLAEKQKHFEHFMIREFII